MNLLAPLLTLETVRLNLDVVSRKRLYEEAGLVFETSAGLSHTEAFDALFAREKLVPPASAAAARFPTAASRASPTRRRLSEDRRATLP